ncbi:MAG: ketol-acid reductoisomerase [Thaumarchaeota archaeon]|nr:ketol-acid reductoisomerase [Nitrososphaerota archaeon]
MAKTWYDSAISLDPIKDETIAVIGYGIQGHAQASNMKDSGLKVIVGARKGGGSWKQATKDGHRVMEVPDACAKADIIHILIPDMVQAKVYREEIKENLKKGKALGFSHGAAVHWKWIKSPSWVDVIMVAPKSPGQRIRELYKENFGVPALVAVDQDYTKTAWDRILGMAKGVGCARAGLIKTTFKEEVETDWFGEQVDLCGGVDAMIRNAFQTLVDSGYQPEIAYFECLHELKLIVDLIQRYGIPGMYRRVSETARYGGLTRGDRVMSQEVKSSMKKILREVQSGKFAKEWVDAYAKKGPDSFDDLLRKLDQHPIEKVGRSLRKMMWPDQTIV